MSEAARLTMHDAVGLITLDRPPVNAISAELLDSLSTAVDAAADDSVRAVVITGDPHFAAGADIKAFHADLEAGVNPGRLAESLTSVLLRLEELAKPVIAAVKGFAIGGGLELALACDFRFLAEDALVGQGEIMLGLIPGAGGTQRLPRLIGLGPARDLVFTGRQVDGAEALELGLADEVHPAEGVLDAALAAAERFASGPTVALGIAKRLLDRGPSLPLPEALRLESEGFYAVFETADAREGVEAFLDKRPPRFTGS